MKNKKKLIALVLLLAMLIGATVGGTVAWLVTSTQPVVNTFTIGNINIGLDESDDLDLGMVPGNDIPKDPSVTVKAGSENCWVYVKIEESANLKDFIDYDVLTDYADEDGELVEEWQRYNDGGEGYLLYGRYVETSDKDQTFYILVGKDEEGLENGCVTVKPEVTKEMMDELEKDTTKLPTLTFTAYAIQADNLVDAEGHDADSLWGAWAVYNGSLVPAPV